MDEKITPFPNGPAEPSEPEESIKQPLPEPSEPGGPAEQIPLELAEQVPLEPTESGAPAEQTRAKPARSDPPPETAEPTAPAEPAEEKAVRPPSVTITSPTGTFRWGTTPWLILALLGILLIGAAFRTTNLKWDEGLSLHPDERFLTMVEGAIFFPEPCRPLIPHLKEPADLPEEGGLAACIEAYLDTANSPLNPRNRGHGLFVYGYLPILLLRTVIESLSITGFTEITEAGRILSVLADLTTILLTFFLGKRLYGARAGLLAAFFLSLSVLNIQNAHFFTVDTFTSLMALLCVFLAVVIAEGKGNWGTFALMGVVFGGAVASKFNVAAFALIIALAGLVRVWRRLQEEGDDALWPAIWRTGTGLALAAILALATFRLAQPYAFSGPGLLDIKPDSRYLENMGTVQGLVSGKVDYYPSHQWTDRKPLWFPWKNMVLWGMGLPLGLAGWAGVALAGWLLLRKRDLRPIIPLAWTLFFFLYQGIQFVKTMRYFLPLYPLLCIFAAQLLLWLWDQARQRESRIEASAAANIPIVPARLPSGLQAEKLPETSRIAEPTATKIPDTPPQASWVHNKSRGLGAFFREPRAYWRSLTAGALLGIVILGTFLWAWGFIQIYRRPVTRATASRWIYQNLLTDQGAWLQLSDGSRVAIPIPNAQRYQAGGPSSTTPFTLPQNGTATAITIAHLEDFTHTLGEESLEVILTADEGGREVLAEGVVSGDFNGPAGDGASGTITFADPPSLEGGRTYYLHLRSVQGYIRTWAVALANEQWDDAIPSRGVEGKDGFTIYRGLDLSPYAEDTPQKIDDLLQQLGNTDYVCLTSNRLYDSIPRLPMRYPATTRYYQALFDGTLGFERVATFTSYPTLFSWAIPSDIEDKSDEERAATISGWFGWAIPDDTAEEAFSVYDHPKVLIFRRTEAFDLDRARAILTEGIDWKAIARIRPVEVPGYRDLLLSEEEWEVQRQGGTWSELFRRDGWTNRLSLLVWVLLVEVLGLATFPLARFLLGKLADGGYLPAKALGILLLGYLSWLLSATKILPYTRATIALALAVILLLGGIVAWRRWDELKAFVVARRRLLLVEEAVFLGGFLLFLLIRLGNPDLWHPWFGGEKPMDFAYLNAIIRSTTFPPYDPWFAGGYLNYYYYCHVLTATLIKLTGIIPSVAYNLAIPLFYGLTCAGVFTVVFHLVQRRKLAEEGKPPDGWDRRAIFSGLIGAIFVALIGNLGEYFLLLFKLGEISQLAFESSIPGLSSLIKGIVGIWNAAHQGIPIGTGNWYWDASRIMTEGEINEFPFFTFLYADLHPHMIALPFTLLIVTQVVALVQDRQKPANSIWSLLPPPWILLGMVLILGTLRCAHFWDFPTYLLVAVTGWAVVLYGRRRRVDWEMAGGVVVLALLLTILSSFLYYPFWARYGAFYSKVALWKGPRTPVDKYLVIHGLFLFVLGSYLLGQVFGRGAREGPLRLVGMLLRYWDRLPTLSRRLSRWVRQPTSRRILLWGGLAILLIALFFLLPVSEEARPPGMLDEMLFGEPFLLHMRKQHLLGWLVLLATLGLILLLRRRESGAGRIIALFILAGLGLTGGVELLVVQGDIGRMNTVFRFYFQTWILWGIASAAALPRLWQRLHSWSRGARKRWRAVLYILVGLSLLYPLLATPAKIKDRFPETFLFSVELKPTTDLNADQVPGWLHQEFERHQISLSPATKIATQEVDNKWKVTDGSVEYLIVKKGQGLNVYANIDQDPGLDGAAFMQKDIYVDPGPDPSRSGPIVLAEDYAAIRWLQENVAGSPVVLEGNTGLYRWGSRISIHTGLPTVIGWDWHQAQQRGGRDVINPRLNDVRTLYESTDIEATLALLRQYRISYIVVGQLERYYYPGEGLAKFEQMLDLYLEQVYPTADSATGDSTAKIPPTVSPYPSPATSSISYPEPAYPLPEQGPVSRPSSSTEGTVIYWVLPTVWENP